MSTGLICMYHVSWMQLKLARIAVDFCRTVLNRSISGICCLLKSVVESGEHQALAAIELQGGDSAGETIGIHLSASLAASGVRM